MAIERQQNIRHATRVKLADNFTLSGVKINDGIYIMGSANLCGSCGDELAPYTDGACPKCNSI